MTVIFGMTPGPFPDLEVVAELGRGADTVVYRVRRRGEEYALKLLIAEGDRALTAVRREAALLGCVGHPLLPKIYDVGHVEAGPYLILEYIDGCPLSETLRGGSGLRPQMLTLSANGNNYVLGAPVNACHWNVSLSDATMETSVVMQRQNRLR